MILKNLQVTAIMAVAFLCLSNTGISRSARESGDYRHMIYKAFIAEEMNLWVEAMDILEAGYSKTGDTDLLYELTLARYGYIGYLLSGDNKSEARNYISKAEEHIESLISSPRHESSAYALQAAFYAYRISMAPWRAVFWGQRSMNLISRAIETDRDNPHGWIEHGNAMFYAPSALGASKEKAIESYGRAVSLMEKNMNESHRWLYLNTLIGLAKSYQETGNRTMARVTYLKALEFEPGFKWVSDELLPGLNGR